MAAAPLDNSADDTKLQFEVLFNYATIGIVTTDQNGVITNFNACAEKQFGYTKDEIVGKMVETLIPEHAHSRHVHQRNEYYKHPEPRNMGAGRDLYAQRKDGSVFPVEVSLSNYTVNGGTNVCAFVIDITVRKNIEATVLSQKDDLERVTREITELNVALEQRVEDRTKMLRETLTALELSKKELSEALDKEKQLGDLKSRFVTLASHEFRTPLSTILSSAYLLEQYAGKEDKVGKHLKRIKNAVSGMKNILEDFLSMGKLEEGLVQIKEELIDDEAGKRFIESVVEEMDQLLKPGQNIQTGFSGKGSLRLDRNLLKNIIINLLTNAIKFSPEGSEITLHAAFEKEMFTLSVTDRGIGISELDQRHLFERFFRAENASTIQGTGLGLHIVKKYVELLSGTIRVKSELGKGTRIEIRIPVW